MLKIIRVHILRFRSIMDMTFSVEQNNNLISICGENNVGKTNTLRAINLFFNPDQFESELDIPNLKNATWGGSVYPKIEVTLYDDKSLVYYSLTRDFKPIKAAADFEGSTLSGLCYTGTMKRKLNKKQCSQSELKTLINKIVFIYVGSINTIVPTIINGITQEVLNLEYDKARFISDKRKLKEAYDSYTDGLQEILNTFSDNISSTFKSFRENWGVEFHVPKNSDSFRDLISDDVQLQIKDKGSYGIIDKGSGLQRLAQILMQFEVADRISDKNSVIICIDEPDTYLHDGLQRKLKSFLNDKSKRCQIFYTTHSKLFIDTYKMTNTILLSVVNSSQYVNRKKKMIDIAETINVDINSEDGYEKICNHLGIEKEKYDLLNKNNIIVEGGCDKKYFEELAKYFKLDIVNIIPANGADNIEKYLEFYNSFYKNSESAMPNIKVVLDNDTKGREVFKKLVNKNYNYINVKLILLPNYLGDSNTSIDCNTTNNEVEDFIFPEVFCYLVNALLDKQGMNKINSITVCNQCKQKSFSAGGILIICEHEKNVQNPDNGSDISFVSARKETNRIKDGLAGLMIIEGNRKLISLIADCEHKYPRVREFLTELYTFN